MKVVKRFFTGVGIVVVLAAIVLGVVMAFSGNGNGDGSGGGMIDKVGFVSRSALEKIRTGGAQSGKRLAWLVVAFSALMQGCAWVAAAGKLRWLRKLNVGAEEKLHQLEAIDVYFDLPLYFGLLGSVLSFILITVYPDAGLIFAYASTAMGIVVSVILRLGYHTPLLQYLIRERSASAARQERELENAFVPIMPPETVRHSLNREVAGKGPLSGATVGKILE